MYDIVIIGAGISGLYACYKNIKHNPNDKILILEKTNRVGGKIHTKYYKDENEEYNYEAGGGVLYEKHKEMLELVKELKIEMIKIELHKDTKYINLIKKVFNYMNKISKTEQYNNTLVNIARQVISNEELQYIITNYGYKSEFYITNSYIAKKNIENEVLKSKYIYKFKNGYSEVIKKLKEKILLNKNITLINNANVYEIKNLKNTIVNYILDNREEKVNTKKIYIALPKEKILTIKGFTNEEHEYFNSVIGTSLCRIFVKYNTKNKKNDWLKKINFEKTSSPLQMIIPINKELGIYQISYSDYQNAEYWGKMSYDKLYKNIRENLKTVFPEEKEYILGQRPVWIKRYYWYKGIHFWKPNVDPLFLYKKIVHLRNNIKIIGESYSLNQGWSEGGIQTVNYLYN